VISVQVNPPATSIGHKKVAFSTMGCKVNTFETEIIAQKLSRGEYQRVDSVEDADLFICNTCTVTAEADRRARQLVRRAIRSNPEAWVVVTGCYAEMDPQACADIPGVDLVVGNSQKLQIPELLDDLYAAKLPPVLTRDIDKEISLPEQLLQGYDGQTRAFVQIQQGCDQGCTFCIIHTARGPNRSFSAEMIKRQCQRLVLNGYAEIVLCGVDIGSYGSDFEPSWSLTQLLQSILEIPGDYRIRLSSIDPAHITDDLIQLLKDNNRICPQLHLSMQSGNTLILKRMKRRASREMLYERVKSLRSALPGLVLSADVLVGFPTETDAHFEDTLLAIRELEIPFPHVFTYSPRKGTPASRIPSQVSAPVRKNRSSQARSAGKEVWNQVARGLVGQQSRVIIESRTKVGDSVRGRMDNYFPVRFDSCLKEGAWASVEITGIGGDYLLAVAN
jgi:threonylcarbamoyladenosine tRNA methylthiotransferase MtaB